MILLPKTPMRKEFDARVGYFANEYGVLKNLKIRN
jgi:hypothetical protein